MKAGEGKQQVDEIDWFAGTWEGNDLTTLQASWRTTFVQRLLWLEDMQRELLEKRASSEREVSTRPVQKMW